MEKEKNTLMKEGSQMTTNIHGKETHTCNQGREHLHYAFVANGYSEEMVKKSSCKSKGPHQNGTGQKWHCISALCKGAERKCCESHIGSWHESILYDKSHPEMLSDEGEDPYQSQLHQGICIQHSVWMWKSKHRWDLKNIETLSSQRQMSTQECRQEQRPSSACCSNRTWHYMYLGWNEGGAQRGTWNWNKM